jgi:CRP-like cAMP-binding protein
MTLTARTHAAALHPFEAALSLYVRLGPHELNVLRTDLGDVRTHPTRTAILDQDPQAVRLITGGWAGLARTLADGRRQILDLMLAGDVARPSRGETVVALTPVSSIDARTMVRRLDRQEPGSPLARAWRAVQLEQQRRLLDQVVRLGSMTAYERTANLIIELIRRHKRAGLGDERRIPWPITQEVVSDVLGLSIVHVNRVLQQLRRDRLIETRAGFLVVTNLEQLATVGLSCMD